MTRVLLYSDEPILAKGLESVLRLVEGFDLMPTCVTVACLMEQMNNNAPDLVLMDLTHEITFAVLSEMKHAMMSCKIVLWVNLDLHRVCVPGDGIGRSRHPAQDLADGTPGEVLTESAIGRTVVRKGPHRQLPLRPPRGVDAA